MYLLYFTQTIDWLCSKTWHAIERVEQVLSPLPQPWIQSVLLWKTYKLWLIKLPFDPKLGLFAGVFRATWVLIPLSIGDFTSMWSTLAPEQNRRGGLWGPLKFPIYRNWHGKIEWWAGFAAGGRGWSWNHWANLKWSRHGMSRLQQKTNKLPGQLTSPNELQVEDCPMALFSMDLEDPQSQSWAKLCW